MIFRTSLLIFCLAVASADIAKMVPVCDVKGLNFNDCVMRSANILIPQLKKGIKSSGFPPLDPMKVPHMTVGQESGAVYLKLDLSDTVHTGLSDMKVNQVKMDMDNGIWKFYTTIPRYELTGNYVGSGKILLLPLGGKGLANFTFVDLGMDITVKTIKKEMDGQQTYYVEKVTTDFRTQPGKNYLDVDRKEGDLTLAAHTRQFLGEHADEVFTGMKGTLDDTNSELYTQLLRKLLMKEPVSTLFKNA